MTGETGHVSALALDEIAFGAKPRPEAAAHAESCAKCAAAIDRLLADAKALQNEVGYRRTLARLEAAPAGVSWWWRAVAVTAASGLALGAFWFLVPLRHPLSEATGIKGAVSLNLVGVDGLPVMGSVRVGDRIALEIGSGGARDAMVVAVDGAGHASQLWPPLGAVSAPLPAPGISVLSPGFVVTPGALVLIALVSDRPVEASAAVAAFDGRGAPLPSELAARPRLPGEAGRAVAVLCVEGEACPAQR